MAPNDADTRASNRPSGKILFLLAFNIVLLLLYVFLNFAITLCHIWIPAFGGSLKYDILFVILTLYHIFIILSSNQTSQNYALFETKNRLLGDTHFGADGGI